MSKEKLIEELANDIEVIEGNGLIDFYRTAEILFKKGYRKHSEGEWKKLYEKAPRYVCTACNHLFNNKEYKYCPNCGAKMKGGVEE